MALPRILILNGPNLNHLGRREENIYGGKDFDIFFDDLLIRFSGRCQLVLKQYNDEGKMISEIQDASGAFDAVVINGGGLSHTSVSLADAVRLAGVPIISVHISNTHIRELYRRNDVLAAACQGSINGLGLEGYALAVDQLLDEGHT